MNFLNSKLTILTIFISSIILSIYLHRNIFQKEISGIHTWRQSQTALNIRNFYRYDANILNPRVAIYNIGNSNIMRYEFPIMQWSIAMIQKVFGENITVIRICMFLIGIFAILGFYYLLKILDFSNFTASLGAFSLQFSPVLYYYTVNPLPDVLAFSLSIWYLYFFFKSAKSRCLNDVFYAALFLTFSTLVKLPFILYGGATFMFTLSLLLKGRKDNLIFIAKQCLIYGILLAFPFFWYKWVIPGWQGNGIVSGILDNKISFDHAINILNYHRRVMFPHVLMNNACWPFLILGIFFYFKNKLFKTASTNYLIFPFALVWLYFFFELNMIGIDHDYYLLPFVPFLFLIISYGIKKVLELNSKIVFSLALLLVIPSMVFFCWKQNKDRWANEKSGFNIDAYTYQKELINAVPNGEKCIIFKDISNMIFPYLVDKQGFIFNDGSIPKDLKEFSTWISDIMIKHNIRYLYSNSRDIEDDPNIKPYLETLLFDAKTIRVYKLKFP